MENEENFNVLALDGGGTRGIYAAQILANIEQNFHVSIKDCFNLIAGTSTGSIIAGAIAIDIRMQKVVQIFECKASQIFRKKHYLSPLFISRYSKKPLEKVLNNYLPSITLGEIVTPLMIMGSDISTGGVYVFKSKYLGESNALYVRDKDVQLRDAVVASCSAPLFFDPQKVGDFLLADGGLWANNPSIISFTEAISKFEKKIEQIKILSIGTGHTATQKYNNRKCCWGFLNGWGREKLISYILDLQSQASTNMARLLLNKNYLRLYPTIDNWALDDVTHLGNLKALANKDFIKNAQKIKAFMNISGE